MEGDETVERMPVRDGDLRAAVVEHGVRPGDPLWGLLVELQRRRPDRRVRREGRASTRRAQPGTAPLEDNGRG